MNTAKFVGYLTFIGRVAGEQWTAIARVVCKAKGRTIFHFLHISKTGGTAVKFSLTDYLHAPDYMIALHRHRVTLLQIPEGEQVIFFLRDPVDRFVSGFNSRLRMGQPRYYTPWSAGERRAFQKFQTPNALAQALSSTDEDDKFAAQKAMQEIRLIRDKYANWLGDTEYFLSRLNDIFLSAAKRL